VLKVLGTKNVAQDVCPAITWHLLALNVNVAMIAGIQLFRLELVQEVPDKVAQLLQLSSQTKAEDLIQQQS
jgi:hypothetical protein